MQTLSRKYQIVPLALMVFGCVIWAAPNVEAQSGGRSSGTQSRFNNIQGSSKRQSTGGSTSSQAGSGKKSAGSGTTGVAGSQSKGSAKKIEGPIGLNGYCPVCIVSIQQWVKGSPEHQVTYDGMTYLFPGPEPKQKFLADPARYTPALHGDSLVQYSKGGQRVPGSVQHTATDRKGGRLFLFSSLAEKQEFLASSDKYINADLAHNGNCVVATKDLGKTVAGRTDVAAIHGGLRYLFPSDTERQIFLRNPSAYAVSTHAGGSSKRSGSGTKPGSSSKAGSSTNSSTGAGSSSKPAGSSSKPAGSGTTGSSSKPGSGSRL